jgi:type IV pilus assembly protein PilF
LRADATNSDAQFLLADICYRTGRLSQAKNRLADVHRMSEPTAQTTWLGLRLERKLGDREEEMRYVNQLRRKFQESREYQLLMQGNYE